MARLHLAGYGPKDTRRLGAGVSVHLTYDDDKRRRKSRYTNRACEFNHEQRTNEFTVCVYTCGCTLVREIVVRERASVGVPA